jgi:pimeloyl-ACP methyl ester carboxylesterase
MEQRGFDYSVTDRGLGDVVAPTLVLWGAEDQIVEPWQAPELGRRIPDASVDVLAGCGHAVQEDCPERAARALAAFLGRNALSGSATTAEDSIDPRPGRSNEVAASGASA